METPKIGNPTFEMIHIHPDSKTKDMQCEIEALRKKLTEILECGDG